jgi:hypothetical protein
MGGKIRCGKMPKFIRSSQRFIINTSREGKICMGTFLYVIKRFCCTKAIGTKAYFLFGLIFSPQNKKSHSSKK